MMTRIALYQYRHVPFIIGTIILLLPVLRAWLQARAIKRKRREKAVEEAQRKAAMQRAREAARARRLAEVAEEERERLRVREEEKARRKAERDAARAAMPKRPRGRPPKAQNIPADNAPQAQPEWPQAPQEPQQTFCWPPRGNEAFRNQRVVFTGKLKHMTRDQAKLAVIRNGGSTQDHIIQGLTTMLVVGEKPVERKVQLAYDCGIRIVNDTEFDIMCNEQFTMTPDQFAAVAAMR